MRNLSFVVLIEVVHQVFELVWTLEWVHESLHAIEFQNLVEVFFVNISVVKCKCNSLLSESSCSSNSVEVGLWVSDSLSFVSSSLGHIIVNDQFDLWNIQPSSSDISCNECVDLLTSESFNDFVSLLFG